MHRNLLIVVWLLVFVVSACGSQPGDTSTEPSPTTAVAESAATEAPPAEAKPSEVPATEPPSAPPTAAPLSPPTILSFTADRTTITQGENVTLSWETTGGTEASIEWITQGGTISSSGPVNPDGGVETITLEGGNCCQLTVRNSAGTAVADVTITIECAYAWSELLAQPPAEARGCPNEAVFGAAAQQRFENGFMIWHESDRTIYVIYERGVVDSEQRFDAIPDEFREGDVESDPAIVPPAGLFQPVRGFGLVWRTYLSVRDRLGWATGPEAGYQGWRQGFAGFNRLVYYTLLQGEDGTLYLLDEFGHTWEIYSP